MCRSWPNDPAYSAHVAQHPPREEVSERPLTQPQRISGKVRRYRATAVVDRQNVGVPAFGATAALKLRSWNLQLWLMLLPFGIGLVFLIFLPAVLSLPIAFTRYNALSSPTFIGLQNFRELLADDIFGMALLNSLGFMLGSVTLRLIAALTLALLLFRRIRGGGAMRAAVVLPTVVPDVAWSLAWLWILNPMYGPANNMLAMVGINGPAWMLDESGARIAIIVMLAWQFGEGFVICLAALSDIPQEIHDLTRMDGARRFEKLRSILWPYLAPYLVILLIRDALWSVRANFVPALIMGQDGGPNYATTYAPTWIYINAFDYMRLGYAAALTWVTFLISCALISALFLVSARRRAGWNL